MPEDVLIMVMQYLSVRDLAVLARCCRVMHDLVSFWIYNHRSSWLTSRQVEEFGWKNFVRLNPRPSFSISQSFEAWSARGQAK